MALFPRYESKGKLTTQQPSALMPLDTTGEAITKVGEAFGKAADTVSKWSAAMQSTKDTRSKVNYKSSAMQIESEASLEPDSSKKQSYFDRVKQERDKNVVGLSYDAVAELDLEAKQTAIKLESMFRKKEIDLDMVAIKTFVQQQVDDATPESLLNIKEELSGKVKTGFLTPDQAYDIETKANRDLGVNKINNDLFAAQTPQDLDSVVQGIRSGVYEQGGVTIDAKEKMKMLRSAEVLNRQVITKENFAGRIQRANLVHDLTDQSNNGILKGQTLEEAFLTKGISNTTYTSLKDNAISPVGPTSGTDHQTYYDLTHYLLSKNVDPEVAISKILDANAKGTLSRDDQKKLYDMHLTPSADENVSLKDLVGEMPQNKFDKLKQEYDAKIKSINDKKSWFKPAFQSFNEAFTGPDRIQKISESTQQLVSNIQTNNIKKEDYLNEADKITAASNLKSHPEWKSLPETGASGRDRFGNQVTVFPNGKVVRKK
jgi:hypothetical protein